MSKILKDLDKMPNPSFQSITTVWLNINCAIKAKEANPLAVRLGSIITKTS